MTSKNEEVTLPVLRYQSQRFKLRIDTGELLFPGIVLLFCLTYYLETRGLPEESVLYAHPLLYATTFLAIVTIFTHAISIRIATGNDDKQSTEKSTQSVVWGIEKSVAKEKHPQESSSGAEPKSNTKKTTQPGQKEETQSFGIRSAGVLIVLSAAYISSLYLVPFVFATAAFLAGAVYLFGERSVLKIVVYSVGFTLVVWLVFIKLLLVPLP